MHTTVSGFGQKLITVVSPYLMKKDRLDPHPRGAPTTPSVPRTPPEPAPAGKQPPLPTSPKGAAGKNNPSVKKHKTRGAHGETIIRLEVGIPRDLLDLFNQYTGAVITNDDWNNVAKSLQCDPDVLRAIAQVETRCKAFWRLNDGQGAHIPAILYERHNFHLFTCANGPRRNTQQHRYHGCDVPGCKSPYDDHPDFCWPAPLISTKDKHGQATLHRRNAAMPDGRVEQRDQYGAEKISYLRLIQAYQRNPEAALKSCSWGKFQIMGEEFATACRLDDINQFMTKVCTSELSQLELLARYIRNKAKGRLLKAVRAKDWENIAFYYNGPDFRKQKYDINLRNAYEKLQNNA